MKMMREKEHIWGQETLDVSWSFFVCWWWQHGNMVLRVIVIAVGGPDVQLTMVASQAHC